MRRLFYNGTIITLDGGGIADSFLVEGDGIRKAGRAEDLVRNYRIDGSNCDIVDLNGRTVLPGLIDSHGHFLGVAMSRLSADISDCLDNRGVLDRIGRFIDDRDVRPGEWVKAEGYNASGVRLTRGELDKYFPEYKVAVVYSSRHSGILNTNAVDALNVNDKNGDGYFCEREFIDLIKRIPAPDLEKIYAACERAQELYASYGVTTIQEGAMNGGAIEIYKRLLERSLFYLDVVGYIDLSGADVSKTADAETFFRSAADGGYDRHFRVGGYKIFLDGSPQDKTAWMKRAYESDPENYGERALLDKEVYDSILFAAEKDAQILAHCNGDAACEQFIRAVRRASDRGVDTSKLRPVMIHAQFLDTGMMKEVKRLNIIPSFFASHIYRFGDLHVKNLGAERAFRMSPLRSAFSENVRFTLHQDPPVAPPDMFESVFCAVNRISESGAVLGSDEAIDVMSALRAVTVDAAYQYGEEDVKGSISENKKADFIIVDKDPLSIPKRDIKNIKILETFKDGESVYRAEESF